jgi:hypothetical protein
MQTSHLAALLAPLALASAAPQGAPTRVALFVGPPGGVGDVVLADEAGGAAAPVPGLAGVRLLPIDAAGRSAWTALLADQPRVRTDVAGAARVLLPGGAGSLYRFRRDGTAGAAFGLFHVDASGAAEIVLELAGSGPSGDADPLLERVGVAAAGDAVLVATTPAAGGDLVELDLASGVAVNRTPTLGPLTLDASGGRLLPTWGVAVAQEGLVRFDRAAGAVAALVPVTGIPAPAWWDGGVAVSADGSTAATIAGAAPDAGHVLCLGRTGTAEPVDPAPQHLSGAGFLPGSHGGPYLALSADGTTAAWRTVVPETPTQAASREAWLGRVQPTAGDAPEQLTKDGHFSDTLDETGLIGFVSATTALLGVGELADPSVPGASDIDGMDLYLATRNPDGTTTIANATLTSGVAVEPFQKGELATEEGVFLLDAGGALVVSKDQDLLARLVPGAPGLVPLLPQTKDLSRVERAGDRLLIEARHATAAVDRRLYAYDPATDAIGLLGSLPSAAAVTRHATRSDGRVAFAVELPGKQWIARADLVAGSGQLATGLPLVYGPALGFTSTGTLALTVGAPGAPAFAIAWTPAGGVVLLPLAPAPAQVLPGAS